MKQATKNGHFHGVRFYENSEALARVASAFLAHELEAGRAGLIVASPQHREAILRRLHLHFDQEGLEKAGRLRLCDTREVLATFMVNGVPDAELFEQSIARALDELAGDGIAVYGEVVDTLWRDGYQMAALRLEVLWNRLATVRQFSLLCGYAGSCVRKGRDLDRIRGTHTHEVSLSGFARPLEAVAGG